MFTSVVAAVLRWSVLIGLLVLSAPSVFSFPVAFIRYWSLNKKCDVRFNLTKYYQDSDNSLSTQYNIYETCLNNTLKTPISNLTRNEERDCYAQCAHVAHGIANLDGSFNLKFMDKVQEEYTKYSNATVFFKKKIVSLFSGCATEAAKTYKSLKEAEKAKCKMNGLYESCGNNVYFAQLVNATEQELCGNQHQ